ncbi:MAG: SLBB domain-containing protein [Deltaproteobacteria bacterium]|nr:SLBB domain-containing protein [Deltaproteobacteria bacterium]
MKEAVSSGDFSVFEAYANDTAGPYSDRHKPLRQFGYDIFTRRTDFDATQLMPVGLDYLLGPGDEIKVNIWGKISANIAVPIDRDGMINLGEFGTLHVAGLTFSEAKDFLLQELSRYYKTTEVKMNVSLGALSSMRVFVVGKAASPGSYTVSSMSTLLNALITAGGPGRNGSLRDIKVIRNGQTVTVFDAYDLLLKGDKSKDIRLRPDDVIFIPSIGPMVAVSGFVKSPGIYEFKGEATLKDAIEISGGRSDLAFSGRARIDRISEDGRIISIESTLDGNSNDMQLRPGDVISVFEAVPDKKVVRLAGAVKREGTYSVGEELTVKGLISLAGGLKSYAYNKQAELTRVTPTPTGPETKKILINLDQALSGDPEHDLKLAENDYLFIRTVPEWELYRTVVISGEVRFPGTYTIEKGETINALISRAGGFTEKAYLNGAFFNRASVRTQQQLQIEEFANRLEYELLAGSAESMAATLDPQAAAQLKIASDQKKALIAKIRTAKAIGRIAIELEPFDRFKGSPGDIALEEGDKLHIPENPAQVQVMGSVYNQTSFIYFPGSSVSDYLKKAGGFTRNADDDEMYILKVNGMAISKRNSSGWLGGFNSKRLDPGDTIVVPEKIEKVVWLREVKDITQILYQIAVTAGVLIVAF